MNQRDQKLNNRTTVLSLLRSSPRLSQAEIALRTRLQPSTTSNLIRGLRELGLVSCVGKGASGPQGGKKADILALRPDYGYFGGIYLKEDEIIFGVADFGGNIVSRKRVTVDGERAEGIIDAIATEIEGNRDRYPPYFGSGLAVSSVVDSAGRIAESLHFAPAMPKLVDGIRRRSPDHPVIVDNDANCAADWDLTGAGDEVRNLVHLQVQTSPVTVGAGIVIEGEVYRGSGGAAGEILQPEVPGPPSLNLGELERLIRFVAAFLDTQAVYVAGELGEETIRRLRERADTLGAGCAVHIVDNPDLPVLGASLQAIRAHINQVMNER